MPTNLPNAERECPECQKKDGPCVWHRRMRDKMAVELADRPDTKLRKYFALECGKLHSHGGVRLDAARRLVAEALDRAWPKK
jgi:hypothetical protein